MKEKQRVVWIDCLRILATWGVIAIHGRSCLTFDVGTIGWYENTIIGHAFTFCVPVFLMLSGYVTLNREISIKKVVTKRVPRVLLMKAMSLIFCACASAIWVFFYKENYDNWLEHTLYWGYGTSYFAILAGCYLVSPFIYNFIHNKDYEKYFLCLAATFCFIVPTFCDLSYVQDVIPTPFVSIMVWFDSGEVYIPVGSVLLYVMGYHLGRVSDRISKRFAIVFFVVSMLCWELSSLYIVSGHENILLSALRYGRYYGSYVSPMVSIYAASVFILFKVVVGDITFSEKVIKTICHVGRNTILIFLLHGIVINMIRPRIPVFWIGSFTIETICDVSLYFIVAFLISLALERISVIKKIL